MKNLYLALRYRWTLLGVDMVLPRLPNWVQHRVYWVFAPPGLREQLEANERRVVFETFRRGFAPDDKIVLPEKPEPKPGSTGPRPGY